MAGRDATALKGPAKGGRISLLPPLRRWRRVPGAAPSPGQTFQIEFQGFGEHTLDPEPLGDGVGEARRTGCDPDLPAKTHQGAVVRDLRCEKIVGRPIRGEPHRVQMRAVLHRMIHQLLAREITLPRFQGIGKVGDVHAHGAIVVPPSTPQLGTFLLIVRCARWTGPWSPCDVTNLSEG